MIDKIMVRVEPGLANQKILYFEKNMIVNTEQHEMNGLAEYLLAKCYDEECFDLHLLGNWPYLEGIIRGINGEEKTMYRMNKINIEVN